MNISWTLSVSPFQNYPFGKCSSNHRRGLGYRTSDDIAKNHTVRKLAFCLTPKHMLSHLPLLFCKLFRMAIWYLFLGILKIKNYYEKKKKRAFTYKYFLLLKEIEFNIFWGAIMYMKRNKNFNITKTIQNLWQTIFF